MKFEWLAQAGSISSIYSSATAATGYGGILIHVLLGFPFLPSMFQKTQSGDANTRDRPGPHGTQATPTHRADLLAGN